MPRKGFVKKMGCSRCVLYPAGSMQQLLNERAARRDLYKRGRDCCVGDKKKKPSCLPRSAILQTGVNENVISTKHFNHLNEKIIIKKKDIKESKLIFTS